MPHVADSIDGIARKIISADELPTYEEAAFLVRFFVVRKQIWPNEESWQSYCKQNGNIYSVYTVEFVDELAKEFERLGEGPIIETFAGNGKLSHHLRKRGIDVIATDGKPKSDLVERLAYDEALDAHSPRIVIAGWPTIGRQVIIDFPTVSHYIEFPYPNRGGSKVYGKGIELVLLRNASQYYICCGDDFEGHMKHEVRLFSKTK